jgi:hypothetical protein
MTFLINVKELPEKCFKDPSFSKLKYCYPCYEYNLKNTWFFGFTAFNPTWNSKKSVWDIIQEIDSFYIGNKYSKLII